MDNQNSLIQATKGWENIGICKKFARKNVPIKLRALWMELVEDSFGYGEYTTKRISQTDMAKTYGFQRQTISDQIDKLEKLKLIKVTSPNKYVKGGGTEPSAYSPCFPKGFGKLWIKETSTSGSEVEKETANTTVEPESEVKWNKEKNIDF